MILILIQVDFLAMVRSLINVSICSSDGFATSMSQTISWTKVNEVIHGVTRLINVEFFKITKPLIYIHRYTTLAARLQRLF